MAKMGYAAFVQGGNVPVKVTVAGIEATACTSGQTGKCFLRDEQGRILRFSADHMARQAAMHAKSPGQTSGSIPAARLPRSESFVDVW